MAQHSDSLPVHKAPAVLIFAGFFLAHFVIFSVLTSGGR